MTIPSTPDAIIVSGLPLDNEENRKRHAAMGFGTFEWPPAYKDSVEMACQLCDAAIWLGPETHRVYLDAIARGGEPTVACLLCCAKLAHEGADVSIVQLTDKDSRKGD